MRNWLKPMKDKSSQPNGTLAQDPAEQPPPQSAADFLRRGYAYYSRGQYSEAIEDFQAAISREPEMVDAVYALGMTLKANGKNDESVQTFQQVLSLLNAGAVADRIRADMLRRLAVGHMNEITSGDWNLRKEIWHKEE